MRAQAGAGVVGVDPRGEPDVVEGERALEAGGVPRGRVDGRVDLEERDAHDGGAGRPALEVERHAAVGANVPGAGDEDRTVDRKSTRLNSSHLVISYAVFCLKKK